MTTHATAVKHATEALTKELRRDGSSYESATEAAINVYIDKTGVTAPIKPAPKDKTDA